MIEQGELVVAELSELPTRPIALLQLFEKVACPLRIFHTRLRQGDRSRGTDEDLHSKLLLGLAVPFDGELTCDHLDALAPSAYRCGQVYGISIEVAGVSFYHQGSANLIDDAVKVRGVDYFLAGIAGRGFTEDYWQRILGKLEPATIVPTHYDDFFVPLGADMGFTTNVNLAKVPDEVRAVSADFTVAALPLLGRSAA